MNTAPTATTITEAALIELAWLASPALPVGGFSYSEGLEAAVESGRVAGEAGVQRWLTDQLMLTLARCDLGVVADAIDAWRRDDLGHIATLNTWFAQTRESRELREQAAQMGRSMREWLLVRHPQGEGRLAPLAQLDPAPMWPIAFALAASLTDAPVRAALHAFTFGWAENMVAAAVRTVPLGQSAGQRILGALVAAIPAAVDEALATPPDNRQAFAPMLAIVSSQHEAQYSRLFRS